jgi:hypothetical protein
MEFIKTFESFKSINEESSKWMALGQDKVTKKFMLFGVVDGSKEQALEYAKKEAQKWGKNKVINLRNQEYIVFVIGSPEHDKWRDEHGI